MRQSLVRPAATMNGRMSKLRRSLSRSVHQLNQVLPLSRSTTNLLELPATTNSTLVHKFASAQTFSQLRHLVQKHNDALREIIAIFEEKASLDFAYSKTMHKLSIRLQKVSQTAQCDIDRGWSSIAEQLDAHATLHSNLGSAINDDVVQPLRSIHSSEQRAIQTAEVLVEREIRKLKEKKEEVARSKRAVYTSSKELEKMEQLIDADSSNAQKFSLRRKKLRDQVKKGEDDYVFCTIDTEKQRRVTSGVLKKGVESLEAVERQRLAHCQTALGRFQRKIEQLGPNLQQMFERFTNHLDLAVECNASEYINSLQPTTSAVNTVTLVDLYAENFSEIILGERRRLSLARISALLDSELRRMYAKNEGSIALAHAKEMSLVEYLEYLYYKVNEAINAGEGGRHRGFHRLARFQQKTKDKQGLPHTVLNIPLGDDIFETPYAGRSSVCDDYEEYDKISDEGFYNSSGPRSSEDVHNSDCSPLPSTATANIYTPEHMHNVTVSNQDYNSSSPLPSMSSLPYPTHTVHPSPSTIHNMSSSSNYAPTCITNTTTDTVQEMIYPQLDRSPRSKRDTVIDKPAQICRVLYDFSASDPDELTVRAGECVIVEDRIGDDWLIGHLVDKESRSGRFPTTYVTF